MVDTDATNNSSGYVFYQGQVTPVSDMPVTGTATYAGSFFVESETYKAQGNSSFNVDFSQGTLNGSLTATTNLGSATQLPATIYLTAALNGNAFTGTTSAGTTTTGKFFGPQAAELAGQFYNPNSTNSLGVPFTGAFGARKQ